ncbi:DUF4190 domain-containing protein [Kineococcus sp. NPDC059986]|jgi:hypothetical protein|uniref:DUF4190 domain-containing protein n=1 Tax=Kineococcus sp. NPDC059986 TaxID=3155538 RepID=UPI00344B3347
MSSEYAPPTGYGEYGEHGRTKPRNGLAVVALVLGILALLTSFIFIGVVLAIVGLILGISGRRRFKRGQATNGGTATAAVVVNVIALVASIALSVVWIFAGAWFLNNGGQDYAQCVAAANGNQTAIEQCARDFQRDVTNAS